MFCSDFKLCCPVSFVYNIWVLLHRFTQWLCMYITHFLKLLSAFHCQFEILNRILIWMIYLIIEQRLFCLKFFSSILRSSYARDVVFDERLWRSNTYLVSVFLAPPCTYQSRAKKLFFKLTILLGLCGVVYLTWRISICQLQPKALRNGALAWNSILIYLMTSRLPNNSIIFFEGTGHRVDDLADLDRYCILSYVISSCRIRKFHDQCIYMYTCCWALAKSIKIHWEGAFQLLCNMLHFNISGKFKTVFSATWLHFDF